jgi:hypothetical protein
MLFKPVAYIVLLINRSEKKNNITMYGYGQLDRSHNKKSMEPKLRLKLAHCTVYQTVLNNAAAVFGKSIKRFIYDIIS